MKLERCATLRWASISFLLFSLAGVSSAQVGELSVTLGQSLFKNKALTSTGDLDRIDVNDGFRLGARFTFNTKAFLGHEFGYAYSRSKLDLAGEEASMPTHQGFYNILVYATPEGTRIRPFAAGGGHFTTFVPPGASVSQGTGTTKFGVNYGGGIKIRVTPIYAVRLDVRDYLTKKPFDLGGSGPLHQIEVSIGVGIYF